MRDKSARMIHRAVAPAALLYLLLSASVFSAGTKEQGALRPETWQHVFEGSAWPPISQYASRDRVDIRELVSAVFGEVYQPVRSDLDMKTRTIEGIGPAQGGDFAFQYSEGDVRYHLRVRYYQADSALAVRKLVLSEIQVTYAAGIPPANNTYGIGDAVFSRVDRDKVASDLQFVAFFNNVALDCRLVAEGGMIKDLGALISRLDAWMKQR
jgi:hypothetical protein